MDLHARARAAVRSAFSRRPHLTKRLVTSLHRISGKLARVANRLDGWLKPSIRQSVNRQTDAKPLKTSPKRPPKEEEQARWQAFAIYTISQSQNPTEWLAYAEASGICRPTTLISAIDAMIQDRNPSIAHLFENVTSEHYDSATVVYAYLKKSEWINAELTAAEIGRIAHFVETATLADTLRRRLIDALFSTVINSGTPEQLDYMLAQSRTQWERLGFNRRILVLRKLACIPGREAEVAARLQEMRQGATPLEELKLRNIEFLTGELKSDWSHQEAEERFLALAPPGVVQDFFSLVGPTYDALRARMRYMEIRANGAQKAALLDRIRAAIAEGAPFSCIRLSDREGYLFADTGFFNEADVRNCENHWWGTELAPDLRARIVEQALEAVATADIVGIPAIHRFIRDVSGTTPSLATTLQSRGLVDVLRGVGAAASPDAEFSEDKVNVGLLGDSAAVAKLASGAHRLIVATSVQAHHLPPSIRSHGDLRHIALPTHYKTRLNEKYVRSDDLLPYVYPGIVEQIEGIAEPGALVLVAGGLVGKILIGRARACGAVALDMGHVMDDWANSRLPPLR